MSYYRIGLSFDDIPGWNAVKNRIRVEAEAGARRGVDAEIPRIREEAAVGARGAVKPLVAVPIVLSLASLLLTLIKR